MVAFTQKTVVTQKLERRCTSHSCTDVNVRDRSMVIDEPLEHGGTNQGSRPPRRSWPRSPAAPT